MNLLRELKLRRRCPSCGAYMRDGSRLVCNACLRKRRTQPGKGADASAPSNAPKGIVP